MKKFFYLFLTIIIAAFSCVSFSGCKKSEVDKISKNLTTYAISAELDDDMKVSGVETIDYLNDTGTDLDFLCLHLYPRAFRKDATIKPYTALNMATCFPNGVSYGDIEIKSVSVNGEAKEFLYAGEDDDILKIIFGFVLKKEHRAKIEIGFNLIIPNSTHRLGYYENNVNLGNFYPVVCNFENGEFDMTPYYSTGDPFCSKIANYEVSFVYSKLFKLFSTGEILTEEKNGKFCSIISAKAVRDFAMCLTSKSASKEEMVGQTKVVYAGYETDENISACLEVSKDALNYFNDAFGKYPYSSLTVVKTPFLFGGMEYPGIVFIADSIKDETEFKKVIVHEIAHQWWYSVVGNNETKEAWLDESLAEYSTALFFGDNEKYGVSYEEMVQTALDSYLLYVDVISTIRGDVNTKMNLAVFEYKNDYEYSYMVYVKGVIMFDSLNDVVGKQKILAGLKKYYKDNKFKIATKADFYNAFESACHKDLETFFEGYLNGTAIISKIS